MKATRYRRSQVLIRPWLQLKVVLALLGVALLGMAVQGLVLDYSLSHLAASLPNDGAQLGRSIPTLLGTLAIFALLLLAPTMLIVGTLITFRIAGPLHRIECHLRDVVRGLQPGPCSLRKGDELQVLCELLNRVTQTPRKMVVEDADDQPSPSRTGPAAQRAPGSDGPSPHSGQPSGHNRLPKDW